MNVEGLSPLKSIRGRLIFSLGLRRLDASIRDNLSSVVESKVLTLFRSISLPHIIPERIHKRVPACLPPDQHSQR